MAYDKNWDNLEWAPNKEDIVDLLFEVVNGNCSVRKAASLIVPHLKTDDIE